MHGVATQYLVFCYKNQACMHAFYFVIAIASMHVHAYSGKKSCIHKLWRNISLYAHAASDTTVHV